MSTTTEPLMAVTMDRSDGRCDAVCPSCGSVSQHPDAMIGCEANAPCGCSPGVMLLDLYAFPYHDDGGTGATVALGIAEPVAGTPCQRCENEATAIALLNPERAIASGLGDTSMMMPLCTCHLDELARSLCETGTCMRRPSE